jgi:hypothetical protein
MKIISCLLFFVLLIPTAVGAGEDSRLYSMAVKAARAKDQDFAFMRYRTIVIEYPKSIHRAQALFAQGEYYFQQTNFPEAKKAFQALIIEFPALDANLFALMYLFKIADLEQKNDLVSEYTKNIATLKQVSLVFRDFKEFEYLSPLWRKHKAVFHIDNVEFFVEGQLFAKISF